MGCGEMVLRSASTASDTHAGGTSPQNSTQHRRGHTGSDRRAAWRTIIGRSGRLSYLFGRLCARLPHVEYERHLLVAMSTDRIAPMPRGYTVRPVGGAELARYRIDASPMVQKHRFAAGMTCLGVFDRHARLSGVTWLGSLLHEETVLRVRFLLPSGTAWDGGLWINEGCRLSRAFPALWAGVGAWLETQGLHRTVSSIADYNAASLAAHRRMGAKVIGQVGILRIGSVQCTMGCGQLMRFSRVFWPEIMVPD